MKSYVYLLVIFFSFLICFIASFDKRIGFNKYFSSCIKAIVVVAIPFIVLDLWYIDNGDLLFNFEKTIGIVLGGLPIEQGLFIISICFFYLFIYFCFDKFFNINWASGFNTIIVFVLIIFCSLIALLHPDKTYTFVTAIVMVLILIYLHFFVRFPLIGQVTLLFLLIVFFFILIHLILNKDDLELSIVNYNRNEISQIKFFTFPIEVLVYNYSQFLLVIYFFKLFQKRNLKR